MEGLLKILPDFVAREPADAAFGVGLYQTESSLGIPYLFDCGVKPGGEILESDGERLRETDGGMLSLGALCAICGCARTPAWTGLGQLVHDGCGHVDVADVPPEKQAAREERASFVSACTI